MSPDALADLLRAALGDDNLSTETAYDVLTVDLPRAQWTAALTAAKDVAGCTFFDWLSAVDELEQGVRVVVHLWSIEQRHHLQLRTLLPADDLTLDSATGMFRGADWHERETHEMFGVVFTGHPNLVPLLLPDGFEGTPLRKSFVLASRVALPWPGAKEPGESDAGGAPSRRKTLPPGVPDPDSWGPQ